jgi:uncharacterized protein YndB with AHSA1/START domain
MGRILFLIDKNFLRKIFRERNILPMNNHHHRVDHPGRRIQELNMPIIQLTASRELPLPASSVWELLARYDRDSEWRSGVVSMTPSPPGKALTGTRTVEEMRFGGRTYRNVGEVVEVVPGRSITWRTIEGADADGCRMVEALAIDRCRVTLELTVRPAGVERLLSPLLGRMLRRNLHADLVQLEQLVSRETALAIHR